MKKLLSILVLSSVVFGAQAEEIFHTNFTAGEGFTEGAELKRSTKWESQDGLIIAESSTKGVLRLEANWARAKNVARFTLAQNERVVITTIAKLSTAPGAGLPVFGIGISDATLHSGNTIPAVETVVTVFPKGVGYGTNLKEKAWAPLNDVNNDDIRLTATITKSANQGQFDIEVEFYNITKQKLLNQASWTETSLDTWKAASLNIGLRGINAKGCVKQFDIDSIKAEKKASNTLG